jgi:hypothetical protein
MGLASGESYGFGTKNSRNDFSAELLTKSPNTRIPEGEIPNFIDFSCFYQTCSTDSRQTNTEPATGARVPLLNLRLLRIDLIN